MIRTQGLTHIHLVVRDLERSLRFYQGVFGMEERFRDGPKMVFLNTPGSEDLITLNEDPAEARLAGVNGGVAHFGFRLAESADRDDAIARMRGALDEFTIRPIKTTIALHRRLMDNRTFVDADYDIHYLERLLKAESTGEPVKS